jgi:hypothetical protein
MSSNLSPFVPSFLFSRFGLLAVICTMDTKLLGARNADRKGISIQETLVKECLISRLKQLVPQI